MLEAAELIELMPNEALKVVLAYVVEGAIDGKPGIDTAFYDDYPEEPTVYVVLEDGREFWISVATHEFE